MRTLFCAAAFVFVGATAASAQQATLSRFAVDTVASIDTTRARLPNGTVDFSNSIIIDSVVTMDVGRGFQGILRPFVQRLGNSGEWNRQLWVAALRYERGENVALRVEGGLIPPPIGLANLTLRPHLNPTIAQPSSLFTALPPLVAPAGPRATMIGALYPFGAQATVSGTHWDVRGAVMDTSPMRVRRIFAQVDPLARPPLFTGNPPQFTNLAFGAGVTPFVGFRVGTSMTHGGWLKAGENRFVTGNHDATVMTVESEFSFLYTKLTGEWTRDAVGTDTGDRVATGWFVQGQQTLTPRWFVAGRLEHMASPAVLAAGIVDQRFNGNQLTLGYRLTPEITLRVEHRLIQSFAATSIPYDRRLAASIVWWKRWL